MKMLGISLITALAGLSLAVAMGTFDLAGAATAPALEASGDSSAAMHNAEGVKHYNKEHWDVAAEHFQEAVAADGNLAEAHYNLALALDKLGKHKDAVTHFKKALDLAPDNPKIAESEILKKHLGM